MLRSVRYGGWVPDTASATATEEAAEEAAAEVADPATDSGKAAAPDPEVSVTEEVKKPSRSPEEVAADMETARQSLLANVDALQEYVKPANIWDRQSHRMERLYRDEGRLKTRNGSRSSPGLWLSISSTGSAASAPSGVVGSSPTQDRNRSGTTHALRGSRDRPDESWSSWAAW